MVQVRFIYFLADKSLTCWETQDTYDTCVSLQSTFHRKFCDRWKIKMELLSATRVEEYEEPEEHFASTQRLKLEI